MALAPRTPRPLVLSVTWSSDRALVTGATGRTPSFWHVLRYTLRYSRQARSSSVKSAGVSSLGTGGKRVNQRWKKAVIHRADWAVMYMMTQGGNCNVIMLNKSDCDTVLFRLLHKRWHFVCLFGFLTSSSITRLYRGRVPKLASDNFTCCHTRDRVGRPWLLSQPVTLYWHRPN